LPGARVNLPYITPVAEIEKSVGDREYIGRKLKSAFGEPALDAYRTAGSLSDRSICRVKSRLPHMSVVYSMDSGKSHEFSEAGRGFAKRRDGRMHRSMAYSAMRCSMHSSQRMVPDSQGLVWKRGGAAGSWRALRRASLRSSATGHIYLLPHWERSDSVLRIVREEISMPRTSPFYSVNEEKKPAPNRVHHDNNSCRPGQDIPMNERHPGTNNYRQCLDCKRLNDGGR
jgi:hypothetical protein